MQRVKINGTLAIPQLSHVIVARQTIVGHEPRPPEQNVGGGLHELLTLDHALTVRAVG